jgi:hypothetical protein
MRGASLLLVVLAATAAGTVLLNFGTLNPCGIVRHEIRQDALRQGGFGAAIAAVLPDAALNAIVTAKYGSLTPGRCISILLGNPQSGGAETVAALSQLTPAQQAAKLMAAPPAAVPTAAPAQPKEAGEEYRCIDPNTDFIYKRPVPCASSDVTLSGPSITPARRSAKLTPTPPTPTAATPDYGHRATRNPNDAAMAVRAAPPAESYSPWAYFGPAWMQAIYKIPKRQFAKPLLMQVLFLASKADCAATSRAAADALTQENTPPGCHANTCTPLYLATCTRITVGNGGIGQIGP